MTEETKIPNPLDDTDITLEAIDIIMKKPPMELEEPEIERICERYRQHRRRWCAAQAKGKGTSRQDGGMKISKKKRAAKKRSNMSDEEKAEMDDILGSLEL